MNEWKVEFSSSECKALKKTLQVFTHRLHFVHCILSSSFGRKFGGPEPWLLEIFGRKVGMPLGFINFI